MNNSPHILLLSVVVGQRDDLSTLPVVFNHKLSSMLIFTSTVNNK